MIIKEEVMELTNKEAAVVRFAIIRDIETLQNMIEAKEAGRQERKELKLLNKVLMKLDYVYPENLLQ